METKAVYRKVPMERSFFFDTEDCTDARNTIGEEPLNDIRDLVMCKVLAEIMMTNHFIKRRHSK